MRSFMWHKDQKSVCVLWIRTDPRGIIFVSKGAAQQVVTSGALPSVVRDIVLYRIKLLEKTSRLMGPFSKDETGHES